MSLINVKQIFRFPATPVKGNLRAKVLGLMIRLLRKSEATSYSPVLNDELYEQFSDLLVVRVSWLHHSITLIFILY